MIRAPQGLRLVPVAAAAWGAAAFAVLVPAAAAAAAAVLGGAALAALLPLRARLRAWCGVAAVALAVAAGVCGVVAGAYGARAVGGAMGAAGRAVAVEATVTGRLDPSAAGDVWFDATAATLQSSDRVARGALPVRVGVPAATAHLLRGVDPGAVLRVRGVALAPRAGAREVVVVWGADEVEVLATPPGVWGVLGALRAAFAESAARLPGGGGQLIPGLAVGDTSAVGHELEDAMKASSLTHLTAVSGANCAIVVGIGFAAAALLGAARGVRIAAGAGSLLLFVLLVTPEPSVARAAVMAGIAMTALGLGRVGAGVAVLCGAVALLLLADPWLALEWGFALSVVATASLLLLARPLARRLSRRMPVPLATAVAVPLAAQLACAPLLVLLDPHVPALGVVANLLAAPAAPVATIVGLFACLSAPLPVVQEGLVALAWLPASWIAGVATAVAAIPGQRVPWMSGPAGALALAVLCAAVTATILLGRAGAAGRRVRAVCVGLIAVSGGLAAGQTALVTVVAPWSTPRAWQIVLCDVGQGDAVLVRSGRAVALVDTGPDPERLGACLERFGVDGIDLLVLTHFDADHVGGVPAVVGRVAGVWHGPPDTDGARVLSALEAAGAEPRAVATGDEGSLGAATLRVHWPAASVSEPGNEASVAIEVVHGGLPSTLLLGDLGKEAQQRMRGGARLEAYDIVKVAHHGSADQDPQLYRDADPDLALVPVGRENDYGHPRASLLALLTSIGTHIARTDTDGTVAIWRESGSLRLWRESGVGGGD